MLKEDGIVYVRIRMDKWKLVSPNVLTGSLGVIIVGGSIC